MFDPEKGQRFGPTSMTGLAEVLESYASRGGKLLGARRWAESPLKLTHVRWQGGQGEGSIEAVRRPDDDADLSVDERDVWVQLALGFPATYVGPIGWDAPWVPLTVSPDVAGRLSMRMPRSWPGTRPSNNSGGSLGMGTTFPSHNGSYASAGASGTYAPPPPAPFYSNHYSDELAPSAPSDARAWTGSLRREALYDDGVTVIPCAEFELPMAVMGPAGAEPTRDFARDLTLHFSRMARGIPQVRETRGWMRGQRLVLAVRMVIAPGGGAATQVEMQESARLLGEALVRNTLPYARLGYAEPGEWAQGRPLPE